MIIDSDGLIRYDDLVSDSSRILIQLEGKIKIGFVNILSNKPPEKKLFFGSFSWTTTSTSIFFLICSSILQYLLSFTICKRFF
jgi:hypothetical protein